MGYGYEISKFGLNQKPMIKLIYKKTKSSFGRARGGMLSILLRMLGKK